MVQIPIDAGSLGQFFSSINFRRTSERQKSPFKIADIHRGFRSAQRVRSLSGLIRDCQSARVPQKSTAESLEGLYELQSTAIVCSIWRIQGRGRGPLLPLCTARVWAHRTKLGVTVISELRQHGGGCHRCLLPVHKSSQEPATVLLAACRTRLVRILVCNAAADLYPMPRRCTTSFDETPIGKCGIRSASHRCCVLVSGVFE